MRVVEDLTVEFDSDGVIISRGQDSTESRLIRYQRQASARLLLDDKRVKKCLRIRLKDHVAVMKSPTHGKCHFANLVICGSVWDCPVCAAKIAERRRKELTKAISLQSDAGGCVLLVTFTYPHQREDVLGDLLAKQSAAMQWFYRHRTYKDMKSAYVKIGRVRALEVNHGEANGWHPHIHELWFMNQRNGDIDMEMLQRDIFGLWKQACIKFGLGEPSVEHGVDVRGGDYAGKYVAKFGLEDKSKRSWGIEDEVTKAHIKKGRKGSLSPFQLLDEYIDGCKRSGHLFIEYSKAFHKKKQLLWSRGLKALFDLTEISDEELAVMEEDAAFLLARIEPNEWTALMKTSTRKQDNRAIILTLAENGGVDVMRAYIAQQVLEFEAKKRKYKD